MEPSTSTGSTEGGQDSVFQRDRKVSMLRCQTRRVRWLMSKVTGGAAAPRFEMLRCADNHRPHPPFEIVRSADNHHPLPPFEILRSAQNDRGEARGDGGPC